MRRSLAFVYGCTEYDELALMVRYHGDIADFGLKAPDFLSDILQFAGRHKDNKRLSGRPKNRAVSEDLHPGSENVITLGSLLAQPFKTARLLSVYALAKNIPFIVQYMAIAEQVDKPGLEEVVHCFAGKLSDYPLEFSKRGGESLALRRQLFGDEIISTHECALRIQAIAHTMHGTGDGYPPVRMTNDFEALGHSKLSVDELFDGIYAEIAYLENDLDWGEAPAKSSEIPTVDEHFCLTLRDALTRQGVDHRTYLAPWLLEGDLNAWRAKSKSLTDAHWLDREIMRAATLQQDANSIHHDRRQARRMYWIKNFSEQHCLSLSENDDQLMTCFRATGHRNLAQALRGEYHLEEILSTELGM
ncbi:hypothetical protein RBE51_20565 [Pseudomonas taiwanensis]|uniref:hypothetical protein n=1 Tax=Pseudomonas taiwanensis TaxID=470150 RepID=UPI0028DFBAAE|nr:hypothetical protein [Pseudomonas taiwanensis]MDT8925189.1 hypothetical protein [Pseudomonas taiwanensis]